MREFWSIHDSIDLAPEGVALEGVAGLPKRVPLPAIKFPRNFEDSNSFRFGGELTVGERVDLRGGAAYETTAIPPAYLSLLGIDMNKVTLSAGAGIRVGKHWRFDLSYAHFFTSTVTVSPERAKISRVNPLAGNAPLEAVNGGRYAVTANLVGVGVQYTF